MEKSKTLIDFFDDSDKKETKKKIKEKEIEDSKIGGVKSAVYGESKLVYDKEKEDWKEQLTAKEIPSDEKPFVNGNFHHQKQDILDLRWGSAYVDRVGDRFFGHGDFSHEEDKNIIHNLIRLRQILLKNKKIAGIWKAYDSDMGEHTLDTMLKRVRKFSCICTITPISKTREEIRLEAVHLNAEQYGQQVYEIFEDRAEVLSSSKVKEVTKYLDSYPNPKAYTDAIKLS